MWLYIPLFLLILGLNIYALNIKSELLKYITKPLLTILLLLLYTQKAEQLEIIIVLALLAGFAGDLFLMLPDRNAFFLSGLFSFLLGHILYILAFIKASDNLKGIGSWFYLLAIPYLVAGFIIYFILKPKVGKLKPCVILYIATIVCMGISSVTSLSYSEGPVLLLPIIGAALFMVSDAFLAFAKFNIIRSRDSVVMLTYGLAQLFITIWFAI